MSLPSETVTAPRRRALRACAALAFAVGLSPAAALAQPAQPHTLRIGFQKYGTLTLLKARGDLERRLAPLGIEVRWSEFPAGPQLLEGLNAGAVDAGTPAGSRAPVQWPTER